MKCRKNGPFVSIYCWELFLMFANFINFCIALKIFQNYLIDIRSLTLIKSTFYITAAKLLKDVGHQVNILEASNRVGGRIYTYRNNEDKWQYEMGPMRIPKTHVLTRELVSKTWISISVFQSRI